MKHKSNTALRDEIYLDYAATSYPKSNIALESFLKAARILPGSRHIKSNIHLQNFRDRIGKVLNISAQHIFFTHGATIALNQVIRGFAEKGCCLAMDNRSHNSVVRACFSLSNKCQCVVASIYDEKDRLIEANLHEILEKSPKLLCLTHVSNVNGSIYPIEKIIDLVQSVSPATSILIDASQAAGALSLAGLCKADFIVFPSHKHLHSLPGTAVLVAKKRLQPIIFWWHRRQFYCN